MANRFLNNITINDEYTLPSVDGTAGQAITTDGAGNLSFSTVDSDSALKITLRVKNVSGGTLNAGTLVRVAPTANPPSGNVLEVDVADNSSASTMPAVGILISQVLDGAEGDCVAFGRAAGFSTSGYTEGDPIWVGSNGTFVGTKPTGSDLIQKVGQIIKVHPSNGSIEVFGAGRTNDVPNLSVGKIWVGTTTNTAESTLVEIDETNNILTVGGAIYYSNVFAQESDLPSATTYHGMFAHVHGTGYAYYAHAGAWVKLAKHSELVAAANDSTITITAGTGLSGGGTFTTDQALDSSVTVNLDNTTVLPGSYGNSSNIPTITVDQQGRITSAAQSAVNIPAGTTIGTAGNEVSGTVTLAGSGDTTVTQAGNLITISSTSSGGGGGGGAELSIERDVFTATANQTAFTISSAITSSSNTQVYIDGVYQAKSNYTTSGSTVTFSTGVPAGAEVEVVHFISVLSKVYTDTFTGDASTVNFTASKDVSDENVTQVYIDGVYQSKDNYTTSGTTITFSTAPPSGSAIEVVHFTAATYSTLNSNQFTGTGSQTNFTLTQGVTIENSFVFIQGVYQEKDTYSISGTTLTFTTAPLSGYSIEVITVGSVSIFNDTLYLDNFNGTGSQVDYTLSTSPASENAIDVYINGLYQQKNTFSLSGSTLTFSTAPPSGSTIEVKSTGGLNNVVSSSGGGISWQTTPKTANFTAVASEGYFVNTTSAAITVTLPSSPTAGDEVSIVDYAGTADTNNITITSSGNINGASDDVLINYERGGVSMVYVDATQGWIAYNAANETATALALTPLTVDYLVVAGGGGSASRNSGGGGAGGVLENFTSTSIDASVGTSYTVTVGSGGAAGAGGGNNSGSNGNNSVFDIYTSIGGGASNLRGSNGAFGGSGGGASEDGTSLMGGGGTAGPPTQGYDGGGSTVVYASGGGGGAGGPGATAVNSATAGNGGLGINLSSYLSTYGDSGYFASGGGGGSQGGTSTTGGAASSGGGARGRNGNEGTNVVGISGTPNTGGGAGGGAGSGSGSTHTAGGAGGSGVVILRYPNTYTLTIGAGLTGSTATDGSDKVTTFTAGTGNISFS